mmetsp:Transcript_32912/g.99578  ORF Transcript_32912/g.99578 Transcript_32912/m.99578 type:complete len:82 (-) Transcript_32912:1171-1416(-)
MGAEAGAYRKSETKGVATILRSNRLARSCIPKQHKSPLHPAVSDPATLCGTSFATGNRGLDKDRAPKLRKIIIPYACGELC